MNKWVERAAIITGALGFIGVLIVSFNTISTGKNNGIKKVNYTVVQKPIKQQKVDKKTVLSIEEKTTTPFINNDTIKQAIVKKELEEPVVGNKNATKKVKEPTTDRKKNIVQKWLTKEDLSDLLSAINNRKKYNGVNYNCVQIHSLKDANNKRATAQVEEYLKHKKFVITGREKIKSSRKGINIKTNGTCLTVVIGNI